MKLEIEKKVRVAGPGALEPLLAARGRFAGTLRKEDRYYLIGRRDGEPIDLLRDPIVRVRTGEGEGARISAKRRAFIGSTEVNEEVEIAASPAGAVAWLFESYLGVSPFVVKRKETRLWIAGELHAELSLVEGLGWFLEVELLRDPPDAGPARDAAAAEGARLVDDFIASLGLSPGDGEARPYVQLLMEGT